MKVIHLINLFNPKNQNQTKILEYTINSIEQSINYHNNIHPDIEIVPIAVFYQEDEHVIPSFFKKTKCLEYDAFTYLKIDSPVFKKVPFLREMFNKTFDSDDYYDYFIYTNADIIVSNDFYIESIKMFKNKLVDVLSITRRTIPDYILPNLKFEDIFLKQIDIKTMSHPGHDTFIFRKGVLEKCNFADVFIGFPPVGTFILFICEINDFKIDIEKKAFITYHLGDDKEWLNKELLPYMFKNQFEAKQLFFDFNVYNKQLKKKIDHKKKDTNK